MSTPVRDRANELWHRIYNTPPREKSLEMCRSHGADHRAYGWYPQYDPRWSPEQQEAYWAGYEPDSLPPQPCPSASSPPSAT
jgi:hypothetical protein